MSYVELKESENATKLKPNHTVRSFPNLCKLKKTLDYFGEGTTQKKGVTSFRGAL